MNPSTGLRSLRPPITTVPPRRTISMAWTTVLVDPEAASMTTSTPLAVGELLHPGDRIVGPDIDRQLGAETARRFQAYPVR